jgi:hypothetical protein
MKHLVVLAYGTSAEDKTVKRMSMRQSSRIDHGPRQRLSIPRTRGDARDTAKHGQMAIEDWMGRYSKLDSEIEATCKWKW